MASAMWRLLAIPCILLALFLVGAPDVTAPLVGGGEGGGHERGIVVDAAPSSIAAAAQTAAASVTPATLTVPAEVVRPQGASRAALMPFYVSLATLEALDVHTTMAALDRGAVEANPMMGGLVRNKAAFMAVKAGTTAGVIYLADRLRTRNRVGAFLLMAGFNSLYATVVANNYRVLHQLDR
jgi:hypothetical protein